MENDHHNILDGFELNSETLFEMRQLLQRRPQAKFSDGLSEEAKLVIHELKEESKTFKSPSHKSGHNSQHDGGDRRLSKSMLTKSKSKGRLKHRVSYVDSIRKSSLRLERDITDPNFSESEQKRRALGGGHVESALETVEIVNASNPVEVTDDDFAIEELARHNSVEKCMVWMEVNQHEDENESIGGAVQE